MRSLLVALLVCAAPVSAAREPVLTSAAAQRVFERNRATVVRVIGPKASGTGVVVGAGGHVLTSVRYVGLHQAQVQVGKAVHEAEVLLADAYRGIALLRVIDQPLQAPAVRVQPPLGRGESLVAVRAARNGKPTPAIAKVARLPRREGGPLTLQAPLPPGTALFDAKGRLVAIAVGGARALPVDVVRAQLQASLAP